MSEPIITITERAAERIKQLLAVAKGEKNSNMTTADKIANLCGNNKGDVHAIRIILANRGCSGKSYEVEYATEPKPFEEVITDKGVKIYVDPAAIMFLIGTEMDWQEGQFASQFSFHNPNEKGRCGCGESFMV